MKPFTKLKSIIVLLAIVAVSATSCKKDKKEEPKGGAATVEAANYGFDGGSSGKFSSNAAAIVKIGPIFNVTAIINGGKQSININLLGVTSTGEYNLDEGNSSGNVAYLFKDYQKTTEGYSTQTTGGGGKVKITKLTDTEAEGTFYIVAHNLGGDDAFAENGTFKGTITKE